MYVNIKKLRRHLGITQEEFASRMGYGQTTISFLEKGLRTLRPNTYEDLCRAFGTELVERFVEPDPQTNRVSGNDAGQLAELIPLFKEQQRQTNELIELIRQALNFIKEQAQK